MSVRLHLPLADAPSTSQVAEADGVAATAVPLQVGDLARRSGKTVRALHLYEELGLLRPLGRSKGRYRLYGQDALVRIRWISKLQDLGLSLHEIRAVAQEIESAAVAPQVAERMRVVYEQKLDETREQLQKLKELEAELQGALTYLRECSSLCEPERPLHACSSCELRSDAHVEGVEGRSGCHGAAAEVPDLVRGYRPQQGEPDPAPNRTDAEMTR